MFAHLDRHMKRPPLWRHLRDVYNWDQVQPAHLTSKAVVGITIPHHVRVFKTVAGGLAIQAKRYLTDTEWDAPLPLCTPVGMFPKSQNVSSINGVGD